MNWLIYVLIFLVYFSMTVASTHGTYLILLTFMMEGYVIDDTVRYA